MTTIREFGRFFRHTVRELTHGRPVYWAWIGALLVVVGIGFFAWLPEIAGVVVSCLFPRIDEDVYGGTEAVGIYPELSRQVEAEGKDAIVE